MHGRSAGVLVLHQAQPRRGTRRLPQQGPPGSLRHRGRGRARARDRAREERGLGPRPDGGTTRSSRTDAPSRFSRRRVAKAPQAVDFWPFGGMILMAAAFFLYAVSGIVAPWWAAVLLLLVWVGGVRAGLRLVGDAPAPDHGAGPGADGAVVRGAGRRRGLARLVRPTPSAGPAGRVTVAGRPPRPTLVEELPLASVSRPSDRNVSATWSAPAVAWSRDGRGRPPRPRRRLSAAAPAGPCPGRRRRRCRRARRRCAAG